MNFLVGAAKYVFVSFAGLMPVMTVTFTVLFVIQCIISLLHQLGHVTVHSHIKPVNGWADFQPIAQFSVRGGGRGHVYMYEEDDQIFPILVTWSQYLRFPTCLMTLADSNMYRPTCSVILMTKWLPKYYFHNQCNLSKPYPTLRMAVT